MKLGDLDRHREEYLFAHCGVFAVALHLRTGWPIVNLRRWNGQLVHSAVQMPDGRFLDYDGIMTQEEMVYRYAERYGMKGKGYISIVKPGDWVAGYNSDGYDSMEAALEAANSVIDGLNRPPFTSLPKRS